MKKTEDFSDCLTTGSGLCIWLLDGTGAHVDGVYYYGSRFRRSCL